MKKFLLIISGTIFCFTSCETNGDNQQPFLGSSFSVTRNQAIQNARAYAHMTWRASLKNISHNKDAQGIQVDTPDISLTEKQHKKGGWWQINHENQGMPYQWGGFDTPTQFRNKISQGYAAGDISSTYKRAAGDTAVSKFAAGIDCSGFVSRCWRLPRAYSTKELPSITVPISWHELQAGDILLNHQHVVLFEKFSSRSENLIHTYEAGPIPVWRVAPHGMRKDVLIQQGYKPRRYIHIEED